jgi:cytoskeletal protein CcmA (bactofilin family)
MFDKNKTKLKDINTTNVATIIGEGTVITGDVAFSGGLHIDGKVEGNVTASSSSDATLTLSQEGVIHGNVEVPTVVIDGEIRGDVNVSERVQLAANSRITGNVIYNLIEMAVGAEVNGQLVRKGTEVSSITPKVSKLVTEKEPNQK